VDVTVSQDRVAVHIEIDFNMLTGELRIVGCDRNPVVAIGMLDYTLARVRRFLTTNDMVREAQEASRIVPARGPLA
jgi:hypothetical protein